MNNRTDASIHGDSRNSRLMLASLFACLLILPLLENLYSGRFLLLLGLAGTFVVSTLTSRPRIRVIVGSVMLVALPIAFSTMLVDSPALFVLFCILSAGFCWMVGGAIVAATVRRPTISIDSVMNAISAYLLFGLAWALSYWAIHTADPASFQGMAPPSKNDEFVKFSETVYYSFVTMTTLGYGDITPESRIAQTLTWLQAVTGQFYVAILVAWLVSGLPRPGKR
jgi:voltage-gated potassium channel